jgi:putative heme iron utilization protein
MNDQVKTQSIARDARSFIKNRDSGVLSTLFGQGDALYPHGSICPFVTDSQGNIIVLISDIALHTKNIRNNSHVAFTVFDMTAADKQASGRVSIAGDADFIEDQNEVEQVSRLYLRFFPHAEGHFKAHRFSFCRIRPVKIHFIKTFGQIYHYDFNADLIPPSAEWEGGEQYAIDHMNQDHSDSIQNYARKYLDIETDQAKLVHVDVEGFFLQIKERFHYINFLNDAIRKDSLRTEFVQLTKE